jgi:predicted nucleic acid-binding protein
MSPAEAQREVRALMPWAPIEINSLILERAWFIESRYTLSWWDSLIVASAQTLGCRTLLTEDLQHGQQFDELTVVNPFKVAPPV